MSPLPDPPSYPTTAYEDFWAAVDGEPEDAPAAVVPHSPAQTDAYAEFSALADD
jgi:hypothetical protein